MALADLPISAFSTGQTALPRVGHRQLRGHLGPILSEIHRQHGAVEVVNDGQREAVVVDHDVFVDLVSSAQDAGALRESIPLLVAAVAAGVAIPSETLDRLGLQPPSNPEALKRFRSYYPVRFTHDENGNRLRPTAFAATGQYAEGHEDELVLDELDD